MAPSPRRLGYHLPAAGQTQGHQNPAPRLDSGVPKATSTHTHKLDKFSPLVQTDGSIGQSRLSVDMPHPPIGTHPFLTLGVAR